MDCQSLLHILGDVASIFTLIGGAYGFCTWVKSHKAKLKIVKHYDEGHFRYISIVNEGPAIAKNITLSGKGVVTTMRIKSLPPDEIKQVSFEVISPNPKNICLHWHDGLLFPHRLRINLRTI